MDQPFKLSILDFGFIAKDKTPYHVLNETLELAVIADQLGYSRFWLTEHHRAGHAWASPEILVPVILGLTRNIRVGPAGILLSYYTSLKVAENFRLISGLFPNRRIDLCLGRGRATEDEVHYQLLGNDLSVYTPENYAKKVVELLYYLRDKFPRKPPFVPPIGVEMPQVWILGSGRGSVKHAAKHGTAFGFTLLFGDNDPAILDEYRDNFQPSNELPQPQTAVAVTGVCAETEAEIKKLNLHTLEIPVGIHIKGTPEQCKQQLLELQHLYQTDEIVYTDFCEDFDARLRSQELLASALGLKKQDY